MLHEFEDMWQGQLGTVKVTEHRIELEPGSRPVRLPPHRSGHKAREVEKTEVEEMLRLDVIEPASTEWSSPFRPSYRSQTADGAFASITGA